MMVKMNKKFVSARAKAAREYSTTEGVRIHFRDGYTEGYEVGYAEACTRFAIAADIAAEAVGLTRSILEPRSER